MGGLDGEEWVSAPKYVIVDLIPYIHYSTPLPQLFLVLSSQRPSILLSPENNSYAKMGEGGEEMVIPLCRVEYEIWGLSCV